jgi:site-specific recombinase XerD
MREKFCLSKHKNGYYYIYYFDHNNKRKSVSTTKKYKSEALAALNELRPSILAKQKTSPIILKEYQWEFLKASESLHSWKTTRDYRSTFNELEKYFGNLQLCQFTQKGIEEFIQKKIREKSIYTGRRHLINIKALFNRALSFNYTPYNPATAIKRIRTPEKLPAFFSKVEYQALHAIIDDADYGRREVQSS